MTKEERKKIYEALSAPFPEECIQRTDGEVTGRGYDTTGIAGQFVINRLNEVVGLGGWRAVRTVTVRPVVTAGGPPAYEATAEVTVQLGEWARGGFVVWAEAVADGGHVARLEADARKGSVTNAFKKAAAYHGVGREAYEGSIDSDHEPLPGAARREKRVRRGAEPATPRQLAALERAGRQFGLLRDGVEGYCRQRFGIGPDELTREQASALITTLSAHEPSGEREGSSNGGGGHSSRDA